MIDGIFALIAALVCRDSDCMRALCIFFAATQLTLFFIPAASLGIGWYFVCAGVEVIIIIGALLIKAPASRFIALMSCIALAVHLLAAWEFPTTYTLMYTAYSPIMNFIEATQVTALFFFSPPFLRQIESAWIHYRVKGGDWPWRSNRYRYG